MALTGLPRPIGPPGLRPRVLVLGEAGIERELTEAILDEGGWLLHRHAMDPDVTVVVLVSPTARVWSEAATLDRPLVLVHTGRADAHTLLEALRRGAVAVVDGEAGLSDFHAAVGAASRGDVRLSARQALDLVGVAGGTVRDVVSLTRRELDILGSIRAGHSVKQTARHLGIAMKTVENIQRRLLRKLGARNRADALMRAHRLGVLAEPETGPGAPAVDGTATAGD